MKTYARIEDGVVVETTSLDDEIDIKAAFHPDLDWRPCPPDTAFGWFVDGDEFVAPVTAGPSQGDLLAASAAARWRRETGGVTVGEMQVPTDERTQQVLTAAYMLAAADPAYTVPDWKVGPGVYVTLDAATIIAIAGAVQAHIQACFGLNKTTDEAILAGTLTTIADVQAAYAG